MKVTYIKDFEYDTFMIWVMLSQDDPSGIENRAKSMGIGLEDLKRVYEAGDYQNIKTFLEELAKKRYSEHEKHIDNITPQYQAEWDRINSKFSSEVEKTTKRK